MAIHFQGKVPNQLKHRRILKFFVASIFKDFNKKIGTLNFLFTDDESILMANKTYLAHDYYTDVITFDLSDSIDTVIADIMISYETVQSNALALEISFHRELHRVIFHGILHLCGLDDKSSKDKKKMRSTEDFYLEKYFH